MVIISEFDLICNEEDKSFRVESRENPVCPICGRTLRYRDRRRRVQRWYNGGKRYIIVRRLKCSSCRRMHTELPDILTPYKHYGTEIIENVVDEVSTPDDISTEDYPCIRTMERWRKWIRENRTQIDGQLKAVGSSFPGIGRRLLKSTESLLDRLRADGAGWLAAVSRAICNTGGQLSQRPPGAVHPVCLSVPAACAVSWFHPEDKGADTV